ncbi:MAG TPA: helix-turn-helix domain-containing protein [Candidatus Baltobacteraceae bacterium]
MGKTRRSRVAGEAGVTKRTLYHHFTSKEKLIEEALRSAPIVLFPEEGDPLKRISGAFDTLTAYLKDSEYRGCPYIIYNADLTDRRHPARHLIERRIFKRRKWFEARLREAGVRHPESVAEEIDVVFDGALASATKRCSLEPVRAAKRVIVRMLEG